MIKPEFAALAASYPGAHFVSVDLEASPANQELGHQAGGTRVASTHTRK